MLRVWFALARFETERKNMRQNKLVFWYTLTGINTQKTNIQYLQIIRREQPERYQNDKLQGSLVKITQKLWVLTLTSWAKLSWYRTKKKISKGELTLISVQRSLNQTQRQDLTPLANYFSICNQAGTDWKHDFKTENLWQLKSVIRFDPFQRLKLSERIACAFIIMWPWFAILGGAMVRNE